MGLVMCLLTVASRLMVEENKILFLEYAKGLRIFILSRAKFFYKSAVALTAEV
jgi:hypothetical protein